LIDPTIAIKHNNLFITLFITKPFMLKLYSLLKIKDLYQKKQYFDCLFQEKLYLKGLSEGVF